jgi:hypothetical protein
MRVMRQNCICHLVKSGIDQVTLKDDGDFFCKVISRDVTFLLKVSALMKNDDKGLFLRDASGAAVAHLRALKANETRWDGIDDCCKRSLVLAPGYLKLVDTQPELIEYLKVAGNWGQSDFPTQAFWKRIACWTKLWAPMRVLTKRGQTQTESQMPLLCSFIFKLMDSFVPVESDTADTATARKAFCDVYDLLLGPIVSEVSNATKARVLSPQLSASVDRLDAELVKQCWKNLARESLLFLPTPASDALKASDKNAAKAACHNLEHLLASQILLEKADPSKEKSFQVFYLSQFRNNSRIQLMEPVVR